MIGYPEVQEFIKPKEKVFDQYGMFIVTENDAFNYSQYSERALNNPKNVVMVSQPDWEKTREALSENNFGATTVITPELITVANKSWEEIAASQSAVQKGLDQIAALSAHQPDATFIVGSPFFEDPDKLPFNSAVLFKGGKIIGRSDKKLLGPVEGKYFQCRPQAYPKYINGANILVCRDLIGAKQTRIMSDARQQGVFKNGVADYVRVSTGDDNLAVQFKNAQFLTPGVARIVVEACWGVGLTKEFFDNPTQTEVDSMYFLAMKNYADILLKQDPSLNQIIVCDRAPKSTDEELVSSKPINAVFFK